METQALWFLIGAIIVFLMQSGFAMLETGFTRAKNAGNILMKNLVDLCVGAIVFTLLGAGILLGQDALFGLIGLPNLGLFTDFGSYDWSNFFFNLVFCATAATIVSGAMAERTKFLTYVIYSAVMSAVIYPIEAHWVWGGGWLANLGFIDFAGSAVIHMAGGIAALIGAIFVGARLGKYTRDPISGSIKVNAIQGHSITLGALGCFILWFGWYGFNGAAAATVGQLAQILANTTIAPAVAMVSAMIFVWIKNGKPDISMCFNAALAGLVGVTAGCANVDIIGAAIIGLVSGILVVVAIEFIDMKLHVDDPVGAVAVHGVNGLWGTFAAGLFSTASASGGVDGPIYAIIHGSGFVKGLGVLGVQLIGIVAIASWMIVTMLIIFTILKKTVGIRVNKEEEIQGLDLMEHGLQSAYAGFVFEPETFVSNTEVVLPECSSEPYNPKVGLTIDESVPVRVMKSQTTTDAKLSKVVVICNPIRFESLKDALTQIGVTGMTVTNVSGCGIQKGSPEAYYRGVRVDAKLLPKTKVEIVVAKVPVRDIIRTTKEVLFTGNYGDGKIFVYDVENVVKIRTGEEGFDALQDEVVCQQ